MNLKKKITQVPLVGPLGKKIVDYIKEKSDERILRDLGIIPNTHAKQIRDISAGMKNRRAFTSEWEKVQPIEKERERLLNNKSRLVDGTFKGKGIYDFDQSVGEACLVSGNPKYVFFLYLLTRSLNPHHVIELGTNVGISSAYIGLAMQENKKNGKIITLDASPYRQKYAKEVHQNLGLENIEYVDGLFQDTLQNTLEGMKYVDFAFIDGHHQFKSTLNYFEEIYPYSKPGSVFIFDDIRYTKDKGMRKAWKELRIDKRFDLTVDFNKMGICIRAAEASNKQYASSLVHYPYGR